MSEGGESINQSKKPREQPTLTFGIDILDDWGLFLLISHGL